MDVVSFKALWGAFCVMYPKLARLIERHDELVTRLQALGDVEAERLRKEILSLRKKIRERLWETIVFIEAEYGIVMRLVERLRFA